MYKKTNLSYFCL